MDGIWEKLAGISNFSNLKSPPWAENNGGRDAEHVDGEDYDYTDVDDDDDCYGDYEDDDDFCDEKGVLGCPFCCEDFDVVGLCCHIDVEHHREAKAAICPVCISKVESSMAVHLVTQHEIILKTLCKKKFQNARSGSALSFLKKELQDEYSRTPPKGSSATSSSAATENDSLFLPFLYNPQLYWKPETASPSSGTSSMRNSSQDSESESRDIEMQMPAFPDKNEEKSQKCEFIQGLLFSMILNDEY